MGQKVNPHGLRVGVIKNWDSRWYAGKKNFGDKLVEDYEIRKLIKKDLYIAGISKVEIERFANRIKVSIYTAKPGMVIGKGGSGVEITRNKLQNLTGKTVIVNVEEVKIPELDAQLTAENIASQIERRVSFRRAMKQSIRRTMKSGATGIKTLVAGRLNGADMARSEGYSEGKIPLQTIRANIEYGFAEADTTYGKIGVKVWISKGEILTVKEGLIGPEDTNKNIDTKSGRGKRNNRRNNR